MQRLYRFMKTTVKDFLGIDIHGSIFVSRSNIESYKGMSSTSPLSLSTTNAMNDLLVAEYSIALIGLFPLCPSPTARLLWVFNCKPFTSAEVFSLSPIPQHSANSLFWLTSHLILVVPWSCNLRTWKHDIGCGYLPLAHHIQSATSQPHLLPWMTSLLVLSWILHIQFIPFSFLIKLISSLHTSDLITYLTVHWSTL